MAKVDNTIRDLHNSSYATKAEFNLGLFSFANILLIADVTLQASCVLAVLAMFLAIILPSSCS